MQLKKYLQKEHKISVNQIDSDALKVIYRLQKNNYKAYVVGGGVRDLLLGKKPKDFDITTDATPRRIKVALPYSRIIGRRFKLVHVYFFKGKYIEVTTFRSTQQQEESEISDKIIPLKTDNVFGTEETDALRRDITINALLFDPSNATIIDYVGGFEDLKNKLVRVIGDPDLRFLEDPVRLLRVIRHTVRSGFRIEKNTLESLKKNANAIVNSSPVRIYDELKKDFCSGHLLSFFKLLNECGILIQLFPQINADLLNSKSALSETIARIDSLVADGKLVSTPVILTVIALTANNESIFVEKPDFDPLELDVKYIKSYVSNFFRDLTISRREKEMMTALLLNWMDLLCAAADNQTSKHFDITKEELDDLNTLLKILPATPFDRDLHKLTKELSLETETHKKRDNKKRGAK